MAGCILYCTLSKCDGNPAKIILSNIDVGPFIS